MSVGWWAEYRDRFGLTVPIDVAVQAGGMAFAAPVGVNVPVSISMDETHCYTESFGLDVPINVGMGGLAPPEYATVGLSVPVDVGFEDARIILPYADFYDDFNRPNSTVGLGDNWLNRTYAMGISSNTAYPATDTYLHAAATWAAQPTTDDVTVSAQIASTGTAAILRLFAFSGTDIQCYVRNSSYQIMICTSTGWGAPETQRALSNFTIAVGDTLSLTRNGSTISALQNGLTRVTWNDTAGIMPRDAAHRLVGIGGMGHDDGPLYTVRANWWRAQDNIGMS